MEARIPFGGFYESLWSGGIDNEEEQYAERLAEDHEISQSDVANLLFQHTKYRTAYEAVAQDYVPLFEAFINELGVKIDMTYKDMTSPREYNFETDKIFVEVSLASMKRLLKRVGNTAMRKAAKAMFTSRDGFISHYRNDITEWGPIEDWDHNQLYCLFTAAVEIADGGDENWECHIYEDMEFSTAYDKAVDYQDLMLDIGKLVGKKELQEEQEEETDDGKRFPVAFKDTADYVAKFI